jgi:hypothetical protein
VAVFLIAERTGSILGLDIEGFAAGGLLGCVIGLDEFAASPIFCEIPTGLRISLSAFRFGGGNEVVVGLGSPVIEARRSPICSIVLDVSSSLKPVWYTYWHDVWFV